MWHQPCQRSEYTPGGYSETCYKKPVTRIESHANAVSARKRRIAQYKSSHHYHHHHHVFVGCTGVHCVSAQDALDICGVHSMSAHGYSVFMECTVCLRRIVYLWNALCVCAGCIVCLCGTLHVCTCCIYGMHCVSAQGVLYVCVEHCTSAHAVFVGCTVSAQAVLNIG